MFCPLQESLLGLHFFSDGSFWVLFAHVLESSVGLSRRGLAGAEFDGLGLDGLGLEGGDGGLKFSGESTVELSLR